LDLWVPLVILEIRDALAALDSLVTLDLRDLPDLLEKQETLVIRETQEKQVI
jgi:hypothetical protein